MHVCISQMCPRQAHGHNLCPTSPNKIVGAVGAPRVRDIVDRWPALLMESQVVAEFHQINNVNLRTQFYKELDRHTPRLITLFRDKAIKTGKTAEELAKLMRIYDIQEKRDVNIRSAPV